VAAQLAAGREELEAVLARPEADAGERARACGELGRLYLAYHLGEAARACLERAAELAPEEFLPLYLLGVARQEDGDLAGAATAFHRALELDPAYRAARLRLGQAELEAGHLAEARATFEVLVTAAGRGEAGLAAAARFGLGRIAAAEGRFAEAVEHFEAALAEQPEATAVHYPLALALRRLGELDRAREHLGQRGEVEVSFPDPRVRELDGLRRGAGFALEQASLALLGERFPEAEVHFEAALAADPANPAALSGLAEARLRQGDGAGAAEAWERLLRGDPGNAQAHFGLGGWLLGEGRVEEAIVHLEQAAQRAPEIPEVHLTLGSARARLGLFRDAEAAFARALALAPEAAAAHLGRARVILRDGRCGEARRALEGSLASLPENGDLVHLLARVLATCQEPEARDGRRALELALAVFQAQVTVEHAETVAMALAELGRSGEAVEWQERALAEARRGGAPEAALQRMEERLAVYREGKASRSVF